MREKDIKEGLGDLADMAERDHEVQMARADLYKIAKYAIKLHDMLKNVSEAEGLEGWQQSKITKASDYISSVYHNLDYEMKFGDEAVAEGRMSDELIGDSETMSKEEFAKKYGEEMADEYYESVKEGKFKSAAHRKAVHAAKSSGKRKGLGKKLRKESLEDRLAAKLNEKSVSKDQQRAAGAALAAKRGDTPKSKLKGASKEMMKMSTKELEKFASTKHKGLPEKK